MREIEAFLAVAEELHFGRYYSPGLLRGILLSSGRGLADLGGLEPGVVVVPSGASLVAAPPS
jgi:hypothetical protein